MVILEEEEKRIKPKYQVEFEASGEKALFSNPPLSCGGDKTTYDVPTYSALRGLCESIYWQPSFSWVIDEVRVMNRIDKVAEHEKSTSKIHAKTFDLRTAGVLYNVRYRIRAHIEWNKNHPQLAGDWNAAKHLDIIQREIKHGGRRDPYFGRREYSAKVVPCEFWEGDGYYDSESCRVIGTMFHSEIYPEHAYSKETEGKITKCLWYATMNHGVIRYLPPEKCVQIPVRNQEKMVFENKEPEDR